MLDLALGRPPASQPPGKAGIRTHLLARLGRRQDGRGRRGVGAELLATGRDARDDAASIEMTAPQRGDRRAVIPLVPAPWPRWPDPAAHRWFVSASVSASARTPNGYDATSSNLRLVSGSNDRDR